MSNRRSVEDATIGFFMGFSCAIALNLMGINLAKSPEEDALQCARDSIGTDQAIVDCYIDRGLPAPEIEL